MGERALSDQGRCPHRVRARARVQLVRPAVFPESDMKTLNTLNNALLSVGAVKANADVE